MKVIAVEPDSPLFGKVRKGYRLHRINGEPIQDNLDCRYKMAEDRIELDFEDTKGKTVRFRINNDLHSDIGLRFEPDRIKSCRNKCIFCFVHQQPKGMRHALYVRDDDYRLSFTHGNFISLSNLVQEDLERIARQRLSPLYVSVHTTDDDLRRKMFGNKKLPPIMPQLKFLVERGITIHTQVVLCPGINDGRYFTKTVRDLSSQYPEVASLGIVPVGLTKFRRSLPKLATYDKSAAAKIINQVHAYQKHFLDDLGSRFIFAADEFYILAEMVFPGIAAYEEMPQFENGIGMMRHFLTDFNRKKRFLRSPDSRKKIAMVTGMSSYNIMNMHILPYLKKRIGLNIDLLSVENIFWGSTVTVSGLLTGRDILSRLSRVKDLYDLALLPPNCLNDDEFFLDDFSLAELKKSIGIEIKVGSYSLPDTLKEVLN